MQMLDRRDQTLAASLAALAGYTDALGYLGIGGFFVSFMSGNSTQMGVGVAADRTAAEVAALLVGAFLAGVVLGSLLARAAGRWCMPAVLALVAVTLALAALLFQPGAAPGSFLLVALGMGALNNAFQRQGKVAFGLTYMTGTLVHIGQRLADAISGGPRWGWLPWATLWAALVGGGVLGAFAWLRFGIDSLWFGVGVAALLCLVSLKRPPSLAG